ncbi:MAG TPA: hypothetical protein VK277_08020 [Acidimicrobiales bacterium]|nr:hypothetical protein [Acidimicrobiales bacterium]
MRYVDAGYAIALTSLFVYGLAMVLRRRRLERAVEKLGPTEDAPRP